MEKRFATFLAATFLLIIANAMLMRFFADPPPVGPDDNVVKKNIVKKQLDADPNAKQTVAKAANDKPAAAAREFTDGQPPEPRDDEPEPALPKQAIAGTKGAPEQRTTLGSVNPDLQKNPFRLLATFTSRGGAIERLELANPRYRDLHDRSGYLGHLSLAADADQGGCMVKVVGSGTPADVAGLLVGDVIQSAGAPAVATPTPDAFAAALAETKPGQSLALAVQRNGKSLNLTAALSRRPLEVMRPEIENLRMRGEEPPQGFVDPPSLLLTLDQIGPRSIAKDAAEIEGFGLHTENWEIIEQTDDSIAFRYVVADPGIEIIKRYKLPTVPTKERGDKDFAAYHLDFTIEIRNLAAEDQTVAYRLQGPTGLPVEGWWYAHKIGRGWSGIGLRDRVFQPAGSDPVMIGAATIAEDEAESYTGMDESFVYTGVDAQYFSAVLIPQKENVEDAWFVQKDGVRLGPANEDDEMPQTANITCRLRSQAYPLAAQGPAFQHKFVFFAGPKVPDLLAKYHQPTDASYGLTELVYYGWFGPVARAMLGILHFFYAVFANYGLAIICLTVLVRGCMFPLSRKQALNMAKMQELQPEMKRLQEKYKKDLQKRSQVQQELFRKHNYNPMGGCLLMFLQLPVFIGLYRGLMIDIELRDAPVFGHAIRWCSNLSAPDMLLDWSAIMPDFINKGIGIFGLGPFLNVLPLVTVGLFIVQQKMFMPPPVDEQAAMQQKVMHYMMIFMGLMFYKVASGLCLYFIASSLWGIAERKLLPKTMKSATATATAALPDKPPTSGGKPKLSAPGTNGSSTDNKSTAGNRSKKKQRRPR